jgi:hypothetical protein
MIKPTDKSMTPTLEQMTGAVLVSDVYNLMTKVCEQLERLNNNLESNKSHTKDTLDKAFLELVTQGESRICVKRGAIKNDNTTNKAEHTSQD